MNNQKKLGKYITGIVNTPIFIIENVHTENKKEIEKSNISEERKKAFLEFNTKLYEAFKELNK